MRLGDLFGQWNEVGGAVVDCVALLGPLSDWYLLLFEWTIWLSDQLSLKLLMLLRQLLGFWLDCWDWKLVSVLTCVLALIHLMSSDSLCSTVARYRLFYSILACTIISPNLMDHLARHYLHQRRLRQYDRLYLLYHRLSLLRQFKIGKSLRIDNHLVL